MTGSAHARESDELASLGLQLLQASFRRLDTLEALLVGLDTAAGSALDGDRAAQPFQPVADHVIGCLSVATDHLRGVQVTVEDSGGKILPLAMYTLIRSAYEAAGTALWLLAPTARDERIWRAMQLTWESRRQVRSVRTQLGESEDAGFTRMEHRLEELRNRRGSLRGRTLKRSDITSVTARLDDIASFVPDLVLPPLVLWQMASGIAHGNTAMMRQVLEHEQVTPYRNGSASFTMTASVTSLAMFYAAALDLTDRVVTAFNTRNGQPPH